MEPIAVAEQLIVAPPAQRNELAPNAKTGVATDGLTVTVWFEARGPLHPAADAVIVVVPLHPAT